MRTRERRVKKERPITHPISTPPIQQLFSITRSVELPLFGQYVPDVPLGLFTFLLPAAGVVFAWSRPLWPGSCVPCSRGRRSPMR